MPYFGSATLVDLLRGCKGQETQPRSGTALASTFHAMLQSGKAASHHSGASVATVRAAGTVTDTDRETGKEEPKLATRNEVIPSEFLQTISRMNNEQTSVLIGSQIADALAHAHERGILHRDLKPANILLTDQGPMLLDFNLAADTKTTAQASAARLGGTLPYMAPEHLEAFRDSSRSVDSRCDIYSLGVILYELLAGRRPFPTPRGPIKDVLDVMIRDRRLGPMKPSSQNRSLTPALDAIISRCLQADPALRYQTARQLQEDLHRHLNDLPLVHTSEPSLRERTAKWYRRNRKNVVRVGIGLAAAAIFVLGGLIVHKERERAQIAAADKQKEFHEQFRFAPIFADLAKNHDPEERQKATSRSEHLVEQYAVLGNPNWQKQPAIVQLDKVSRDTLFSELGQVLVVLGQTELSAARTSKESEARLEKAKLYCDRAETCYPSGNVPRVLWQMRAEIASLKGEKAAAERFSNQGGAADSEPASSRRLLALYELSKGHLLTAMRAFKQLSQQEPGSPATWFYLGNGYLQLARYSDALTCYSVCVALAPHVSRYHYDRGVALYNLGDFRGAVAEFDELLRREPANVNALLSRAQANRNLGEFVSAIADLDVAAEQSAAPLARIHFLKSAVYAAKKDLKAADEENQLGLKSPATTELDWIARGLSEMRTDPERGLEDFNEALRLNPESLGAMRNKALVLSKIPGRLEEAVAVLDQALNQYPESVLARTARGTLLARLGKRDLAIKDAEECLRLDSQPAIRYRVAGIYAAASRLHTPDAIPALGNLAAAFKSGYGADLVDTDKDLDPIRAMPEFQKLWASAQMVRDTAKRVGVR
jgi:tetratricopeptide (TPR) repeat protein